MDMDRYLKRIYFNPRSPFSYSSPSKLYLKSKRDGKGYKLQEIKDWLAKHEEYTLFKPSNKVFSRNKIIFPYEDYQYTSDTMNMKAYANDNDEYAYVLVILDAFTRFAWTFPLRSLRSEEVATNLREFFRTNMCEIFRTDGGSEYKKEVKTLLRELGIVHSVSKDVTKAPMAERFIKTIKTKLLKISYHDASYRWLEDLPIVTKTYNNSYHSSIKMTPLEATKADTTTVWDNQYLGEEIDEEAFFNPPPQPNPRRKDAPFRYKFSVGDTVRVTRMQGKFDKEYDTKWTHELFTIAARSEHGGIPRYTLMTWKDKDGKRDLVEGDFYEGELQSVDIEHDPLFRIENVVREEVRNGQRMSLVKYLGWPARYNLWIPSANVRDIVAAAKRKK